MKKLVFKNRETGKLKSFYCDARISNLEASRQYKEANGKEWALVMSKHWIPKKEENHHA